jgi:hypothetical protein
MKTIKKISTGATVLLAVVVMFGMFKGHALAADVAQGDIANGTYTFQDRANIIGDYGSSGKVTFTDVNPTDSTRNYKPLQGGFCQPSGSSGNYGITIGRNASLSATTISGQLDVGYSIGNNCTEVKKTISIKNPQNPVPVAAATFEWNNDNIVSFPNETARNLTFTKTNTQNGKNLYFSDQQAGNCSQNGAIVLDDNSQNTGSYFTLSGITIGRGGPTPSVNLSSYPLLNNTGAVDSTKCHVDNVSHISISGTQGQPAPNGGGTNVTSGDASSSCEAVSGSPLAWFMCPLFSAAAALTQSTLNLFEGLLSFTVSHDLSGNCPNNQNCQASVKLTWSIIKNLASVVLVIIMMLMVFSQAVNFGPFDAYTIRKLLPKLVAAVILMQLSWPLVSWVIDLVNDLGKGIMDFLYAPFGGPSTLNDFGKVLHHAGIGTGESFFVNWVGLLAVGTAAIAALPTALFLIFASLMGLLVAVVTLIFRKILIIMLLIFAPIAFVAWVLPGTERFWKLWWDNLIKVLMMFPLAVGIIAAGRIFAYVAGPQANTGDPFLSHFLPLVFVAVGFFGPLFLIPRTFKWGGSIMSMAGGAINNVGNSINKRMEQPIKGYGERWQGSRAKRYNPSEGTWKRGLRRVQSGHLLPTERSRRLTIAEGNKWAGERNEEAQALVERTYEKALTSGYDKYDVDKDGNFLKIRQDADGKYIGYRRNEQGQLLNSRGEAVENEADAEITNVEKRSDAIFDRVNDISKASKDRVTGVEAGKQALLDIAGNDATNDSQRRAAQAAHKQLLDTSSWIEVQNARIQTGKHTGRRASEVAMFRDTLENSPQHYSATIKSRPDMAPDVIESAENKVGITYDQAYASGDKEAVRRLDKARLTTTLERLSPDAVPSLHFGVFQDIDRLGDAEVSNLLATRLEAFRDSGTTVGSNAIGSLTGAQMRKRVEEALSHSSHSASLDSYLPGGRVSSSAAAPTAQPRADSQGGQQQVRTQGMQGGGVINITHEQDVLRQSVPVPTEMLNTPDSSGWTPRDYANAENQARDEFNHLRGLSARTLEQEQRFQYYRANFPNW